MISKNIPKDVKSRKRLGFGRPQVDIVDAKYEARVVKSQTSGDSFVFFDFKVKDEVISWGISASDLLGLENNPVDESQDRLVQESGWVASVPVDKAEKVLFRKVS